MEVSSVGCCARVTLRFRFREGTSGLLFGAISGQKGGFWAVLGGFSAPSGFQESRTSSTSHGKPPNLARFEGNLGTNGTSWHHIFGTTAPHIWHHGTTHLGTTYPSQSYQSWHHRFWYLGTSHLTPHWHLTSAPHIWHLIFST